MENLYELAQASAQYLKPLAQGARAVLILGSGLAELAAKVTNPTRIPYSSIPNFPSATTPGQGNELIIGYLSGIKTIIMTGRFHYYEGYTMKEITYPLYVFKLLEIPNLIITNASGALNDSFVPGDLMIIRDFVNLMGTNPLIGSNDERFGPRFPDMSHPYHEALITTAKQCASDLAIDYHEGVYGGFMGPCYESAAEIRAFKTLGIDAIGMSTVPETIIANYLGINTLAICCITNMATGLQRDPLDHGHVLAVASRAGAVLGKWLEAIVAKI